MIEVALGLGSNLGRKADHLREAATSLRDRSIVPDLVLSPLYRTAPWGHVVEQDWFVNACAWGHTALEPEALLAAVKDLEAVIGRTATVRWGPRVIDIDILYYGDLTRETPGLVLPHREILNRAFVLVPLADIRPDRRIGGRRVADLAVAADRSGIVPYEAASEGGTAGAPCLTPVRRLPT